MNIKEMVFSKMALRGLATLGFAAALMFSGSAGPVAANPPDVDPGLKLAFKFNLIGYPAGQEYTGGCGNGSRMFVNRGAAHAHILVADHNDGWHIEDCNATADNRGELHTDEVGLYKIYVRILGKPGGHLKICADLISAHDDADGDLLLCELGIIDLTRGSGQSKFQVAPSTMFDAEAEDIMWSIETNTDYRLAQFRVYRLPAA